MPEPSPTPSNAAERLVRAYYAAFNGSDMARFLDLLTEDVIHDISQGGREIGRAGFARFLGHMNRCYRERIVDLVVLTEPTGTRAAAEFIVEGTYIATDPGVPAGMPPASGQTYRLPAGAFFAIRDGRIARVFQPLQPRRLGPSGRRPGMIPARRDAVGFAVVAGAVAALVLYRHAYIEPREWGAICAPGAPNAPIACLPRAALLWLQYQYFWGLGALALGLWAFLGGPFWIRIAAVVLGIAAVINYNATWGMVGAALGVWAWLCRPQSGVNVNSS